MTETQQRFLRAIAERLGERHPVEVRLFPSMRAGQHESGVAVVALEGHLLEEHLVPAGDAAVAAGAEPPSERTEDDASEDEGRRRLSILTARYRLTLKGPDRGKWEFSMVHDADAPHGTIDPVVRGVARRVGDLDEPQLLDAEAFARAIAEPWWTTTA